MTAKFDLLLLPFEDRIKELEYAEAKIKELRQLIADLDALNKAAWAHLTPAWTLDGIMQERVDKALAE